MDSPNEHFALVSLVETEGSSYLQPGARLLVREDGAYWGEISAGCLEEKVSAAAVESIRADEHRIIRIDTRPLYGCFGVISLLIEVLFDRANFLELLQKIDQVSLSRIPLQLRTSYKHLANPRLTEIISNDCEAEGAFIQSITPPNQLLVFGDWKDGRAAAEIGQKLGWKTALYDASAPEFPIEPTLENHKIDSKTAILIATHNLARDARCLKYALSQDYSYIGVVGSRKRRLELQRIISEFDDFSLIERFESVHCPAGLDIGGEGSQAIALSIIAEIQAALSQRSGQPLSHREKPIHLEEFL
ncbi:MAG: XdhC family protein [Verrucomicrobiota bacterium]